MDRPRTEPPAQPPISAATVLCAILLHPSGHTRSPAMHNAAFAALGLDARYLAFDVTPAQLADALQGARAMGLRQLAISVPHKETALPLVDELDETAQRIGALNTVTRRGERLVGANTDWLGAIRALERATRAAGERALATLAGKRAVVLGAGGTARAVTFGLVRAGAVVTVLNRSPERAADLVHSLGASASGALEELGDLDFEILVNTTSVGMGSEESPARAEHLHGDLVVLDAVYAPENTRLLRDAHARGAATVGGKWMLVAQAVEQIRLWTGLDAPADAMARAFDDAAG